MDLHILNDGQAFRCAKTEVAPAIEALLSPLVRDGGLLPRPFEAFRVEVCHIPGGTQFSLWRERYPVITAALARTTNGATELWRHMEEVYCTLSDKYPVGMGAQHVPGPPKALPWLAMMYLPAYRVAARGQVGWFKDFVRCFGWVLLTDKLTTN